MEEDDAGFGDAVDQFSSNMSDMGGWWAEFDNMTHFDESLMGPSMTASTLNRDVTKNELKGLSATRGDTVQKYRKQNDITKSESNELQQTNSKIKGDTQREEKVVGTKPGKGKKHPTTSTTATNLRTESRSTTPSYSAHILPNSSKYLTSDPISSTPRSIFSLRELMGSQLENNKDSTAPSSSHIVPPIGSSDLPISLSFPSSSSSSTSSSSTSSSSSSSPPPPSSSSSSSSSSVSVTETNNSHSHPVRLHKNKVSTDALNEQSSKKRRTAKAPTSKASSNGVALTISSFDDDLGSRTVGAQRSSRSSSRAFRVDPSPASNVFHSPNIFVSGSSDDISGGEIDAEIENMKAKTMSSNTINGLSDIDEEELREMNKFEENDCGDDDMSLDDCSLDSEEDGDVKRRKSSSNTSGNNGRNNWGDSINNSSGGGGVDGGSNSGSSNNVSVEDKAKEKNREHAKNTRMRKKNYIENLKENLKALADERDKADIRRRSALTQLVEKTTMRKRTLSTFFSLRENMEMRHESWSSILDDDFVLVLPITPYRSFPPHQVINGQRVVSGIDATIMETSSFYVMLQSMAETLQDNQRVRVEYTIDPESIVACGDNVMFKWSMRTINARETGSRDEVSKHGMAKASFAANNKLSRLEMTFDVMSFMHQLRRISGKHDFQIVPSTLPIACEDSPDARVVVEINAPHTIIFVNKTFCEQFNYVSNNIVGKPLEALYGPKTEMEAVRLLFTLAHKGSPGASLLTCYTSDAEESRNSLRIYPLYANMVATHFLLVMVQVMDRPASIKIANFKYVKDSSEFPSLFHPLPPSSRPRNKLNESGDITDTASTISSRSTLSSSALSSASSLTYASSSTPTDM